MNTHKLSPLDSSLKILSTNSDAQKKRTPYLYHILMCAEKYPTKTHIEDVSKAKAETEKLDDKCQEVMNLFSVEHEHLLYKPCIYRYPLAKLAKGQVTISKRLEVNQFGVLDDVGIPFKFQPTVDPESKESMFLYGLDLKKTSTTDKYGYYILLSKPMEFLFYFLRFTVDGKDYLVKELVNDFRKSSKEYDFSEFTQKIWKIINYLLKKGTKSTKTFLPLMFIKLDYEGKVESEATEIIPTIKEICEMQDYQEKTSLPLHDSIARYFAFLLLHHPKDFIDLPKNTWFADSQKIAANILSISKLNMDKTCAEPILFMLLETSSGWDRVNKIGLLKLYILNAKDFTTLIKNTLNFVKELSEILESDKFLTNVTEKLATQAKEENIWPLKILHEVKGDISEGSYMRIAKKLVNYSKSIQEIEELYKIACTSDDEDLWRDCEFAVHDALKEMPLKSLLQEIISMKTTRRMVKNSRICEEFQNKFERQPLKIILDLSNEIKPVLKEFPSLMKFLFQRATKFVSNAEELSLLGEFYEIYCEFLVENDDYWGEEGPIDIIKSSICQVIQFTTTIKEVLGHFEHILTSCRELSRRSKELCNFLWEKAFIKYGEEDLFKGLSVVSQLGTAEVKSTYTTNLMRKVASNTLHDKEFEHLVSLLFPGESTMIDLTDPLMDHVFSQLIERLQLPEDIFSVISQLDKYHAWAKILCFQNGERYKKVTQYQHIRELISLAATEISSLCCTISEASKLAELEKHQFEVFQENYINKIDAKMNCMDSFSVIQEIYHEAISSKQHMENLLTKYLSRAVDYSDAQNEYDLYCQTLPSVLVKDYKNCTFNRPFKAVSEKIFNISTSKLFDRKFNENLLQKSPTVEDVLESLQCALIQMEEEIKAKLVAQEPVSAEFLEQMLSEIKAYEEKEDEIKILAQSFGLEEIQKESLLQFINVMRKKDEFLKHAEIILRFAEMKKFLHTDMMIQGQKDMEKKLLKNKAAYTHMVQVFKQIQEAYSKIFGDTKLLEVLEIYGKEGRLLEFVASKDENEIRTMIEKMGDFGDLIIKASEIAYLFELRTLFDSITLVREETLKDTLEALQNKLQDPNYPDIVYKIGFCKEQLSLLEQLASQTEALGAIIKNVATKGVVRISLKRSSYTAILTMGGNHQMRGVKIDEAIRIRDRLQLILKAGEITHSDEGQWTSPDMRGYQTQFIEVVDLVEEIIITLQSLFRKGYPQLGKWYGIDCHNKEELLKEKQKLKEFEVQWDKAIREAYNKNYVLTSFYGRQFNQLLNYLGKKPRAADPGVCSLLRHIFGKDYRLLSFNDFNSQKNENLDELLQDLGDYLAFKLPPCTKDFSLLQKENKIKKRILVVTSPTNLIEIACTLYLRKTAELPTLSNCLYCHKNTSIEEVYAFIRRYIQCPTKELFSILRIEDLDGVYQESFLQFLTSAYQERNVSAVLAVLVADIDAPIAKQLTTLGFFQENIRVYDESTLDKYFQEKVTSKTHIVASDQAGIGKSRWISQQHEN